VIWQVCSKNFDMPRAETECHPQSLMQYRHEVLFQLTQIKCQSNDWAKEKGPKNLIFWHTKYTLGLSL